MASIQISKQNRNSTRTRRATSHHIVKFRLWKVFPWRTSPKLEWPVVRQVSCLVSLRFHQVYIVEIVWESLLRLALRAGEKLTCNSIQSEFLEPARLLLNAEIETGCSYPYRSTMSSDSFLAYFCSHDAFQVTGEDGSLAAIFYIKVVGICILLCVRARSSSHSPRQQLRSRTFLGAVRTIATLASSLHLHTAGKTSAVSRASSSSDWPATLVTLQSC